SWGFTLFMGLCSLVAIIGCASLPPGWNWTAGVLLIIYAVVEWWRHVCRWGLRSLTELRCQADATWAAKFSDGRLEESLTPGRFVFSHPLLVLISFHSARGKHYWITVPRDGTSADSFRKLRVRLRSIEAC
ncbi:MAG: protein YgfX, partial [Gammaproteobacteria bacterium]